MFFYFCLRGMLRSLNRSRSSSLRMWSRRRWSIARSVGWRRQWGLSLRAFVFRGIGSVIVVLVLVGCPALICVALLLFVIVMLKR